MVLLAIHKANEPFAGLWPSEGSEQADRRNRRGPLLLWIERYRKGIDLAGQSLLFFRIEIAQRRRHKITNSLIDFRVTDQQELQQSLPSRFSTDGTQHLRSTQMPGAVRGLRLLHEWAYHRLAQARQQTHSAFGSLFLMVLQQRQQPRDARFWSDLFE